MYTPTDVDLKRPKHIAQLEERRIARAVPTLAPASMPWLDGVLCRGEPGAWLNQGMGIGLDGSVPTGADVDELIAFYEPHDIEAKLEITPYVSPELLGALAARGFIAREIETVLVRDLTQPLPERRNDIVFRVVDSEDNDAVVRAAKDMQVVFSGEREPSAGECSLNEMMVRYPGATTLAVQLEGEEVGFGVVEVAGPIAALYYGSTAAHARRRGVQAALIAERLRIAKASGCTIALIGSGPDAPTERNALRAGFHTAYHKVMLVKPGAGLEPSP